jgi:hypothetical protein
MERVAPDVKDITEEEIAGTGQWHQKFTLFVPGDRAAIRSDWGRLDLSGPEGPDEFWKTLTGHRFRN